MVAEAASTNDQDLQVHRFLSRASFEAGNVTSDAEFGCDSRGKGISKGIPFWMLPSLNH